MSHDVLPDRRDELEDRLRTMFDTVMPLLDRPDLASSHEAVVPGEPGMADDGDVVPLGRAPTRRAPRPLGRMAGAAAVVAVAVGGLMVATGDRDRVPGAGQPPTGSVPTAATQPVTSGTDPDATTGMTSTMPAATTTTSAPGPRFTLLALDTPPPGFELTQARVGTGPDGVGIAVYTTAESSTELHLVMRGIPLPTERLGSLGFATWEIDGRTVWSDGEIDGCLPDACSIGIQWDDATYVSIMWVDPNGNDLVSGSTQERLLDLVPALVDRGEIWERVSDVETVGTVAGTVPIVPGEVVVANSNGIGGSAGQLSSRLQAAGFDVGEPVNGTSVNRRQTIVHVRPGAECLAGQVARAIGADRLEAMTEPLPIADPNVIGSPDVIVELGDDIAGRLASADDEVDLGPTGRLVVVDALDDELALDSVVTELTARGIDVLAVLPATRTWPETTFHPIGAATPWACGVAAMLGIGGFDEWRPDVITGELPEGADAVVVLAP